MTLGLTSENKIKIKTDSPGLRAVECGCCVGVACEGYSFEGIIISKEEYSKWLKGGTIHVSGSIFDTSFNSQYQIDNGCPNGTCSWSYSNTVIVPPNTCVFQFSDHGPISCSSSYYGENQSPFIFLQARAYKSKDEEGEVYRAKLVLIIGCPHILWLSPCSMDICWYNSIQCLLGNTDCNGGAGMVEFLGQPFSYNTDIARNSDTTPDSTANLTFSFVPNP